MREGWDIKVITVKERYYKYKNAKLLEEVKNAHIIRTRRLPRLIKGINEEGLYWLPFLLFRLLRELKNEHPDIVFLTGGPFIHWIIAPLVINELYKIPYVLDFRDPWRLSPYRRVKTVFSYGFTFLSRVIEPLAVKKAHFAINVTEQATEMYRETYNELSQKFITIYNGFDPEDIENVKEPISFSDFDIIYVGKFGGFRNPLPFLEAFKKLVKAYSLSPEQIHFVWVGIPEGDVVKIIDDLRISNYCKLVGYKPYREALCYIKGAKVCLLISGNHPFEPTTKFFDYIALDKPILALLGAEGFLSSVLDNYCLAVKILNPNVEKVFNGLKKLIENFHQRSWIPRSGMDLKKQFNRQITARKLSEILSDAIR